MLEDDEIWEGETREEYGGFTWNDETIEWLIKDEYYNEPHNSDR